VIPMPSRTSKPFTLLTDEELLAQIENPHGEQHMADVAAATLAPRWPRRSGALS